jgi:hypothetical protein
MRISKCTILQAILQSRKAHQPTRPKTVLDLGFFNLSGWLQAQHLTIAAKS